MRLRVRPGLCFGLRGPRSVGALQRPALVRLERALGGGRCGPQARSSRDVPASPAGPAGAQMRGRRRQSRPDETGADGHMAPEETRARPCGPSAGIFSVGVVSLHRRNLRA
ncbi:unnamed protein product [Prorocentrum cordatum]|uniref:Uncharacterized protein n=1 Tax=Prorocentrum cordatum TaxID=2364126 RepID=A0ABN9SPP5_9DINO|nr:unnamed protein product [Polarella glacialis]